MNGYRMCGNKCKTNNMCPTCSSGRDNFAQSLIIHYNRTPFESPPPLERPLNNVNLNINVLIFTRQEATLLKGHFSYAKEVASQEGFHCADEGTDLTTLSPNGRTPSDNQEKRTQHVRSGDTE